MANLFQPSLQRATDSNGDPVSGAKMFFYLAGTTTPATWYADQDGNVPGGNPLVSDSSGKFTTPAYLDPEITYRVRLTANDGVTLLWPDVDNVRGYDIGAVQTAAESVIGAVESVELNAANAAASEVAAEAALNAAEAARDQAALHASAAVASGNIYADTTAGIAGTVSGDYFLVPDSTGDFAQLYLNDAGTAVSQAYRLAGANLVESVTGRIERNEGLISRVDEAPEAFNPNGAPESPETIFGDDLIAYFGMYSRRQNAAGAEASVASNEAIAKIYGAGAFPVLSPLVSGAGSTKAFGNYTSNKTPTAATGTGFPHLREDAVSTVVLETEAGAGAAWLAGNRPLFFVAWDDGFTATATDRKLFTCGDLTVQASNTQVQMLVGGVLKYVWPIADHTGMINGGEVVTDRAAEISWWWDKETSTPYLEINGSLITPSTATTGTSFTSGSLTFGPMSRVYYAGFVSDFTPGQQTLAHDYHDQPAGIVGAYVRDLSLIPAYLATATDRTPFYRRPFGPLPAQLKGPFSLHVEGDDITLSGTVDGNIPRVGFPGSGAAYELPAAPNVEPSSETQDNSRLQHEPTRGSILEHPLYPGDPDRKVMMASSVWNGSHNANYKTHIHAYETTTFSTSGKEWTPVAQGHVTPPSGTTDPVNNIMRAGMGRFTDLTPWFPDGFTVPGYESSLPAKSFLVVENDGGGGGLYAIPDPLDYSTWYKVAVKEHCLPHLYGGIYEDFLSTDPDFGSESYRPGKRHTEEKGLTFCPQRGTFLRIVRQSMQVTRSQDPNARDADNRSVWISESRYMDPTRWPKEKLRPLVLPTDCMYQAYDVGFILQVRPDQWVIPVYSFAHYSVSPRLDGSGYPNSPPNTVLNWDRNLKTWTDLYASYDGLESPLTLLRSDFLVPRTADTDYFGSMVMGDSFHPTLNNLYLNTSRRLHNTAGTSWQPVFDFNFSKVDGFTFPDTLIPDRYTATGTFQTEAFDASKVKALWVEKSTTETMVRVRLVHAATGRVVPGCTFHDCYIGPDGIVRWQFNPSLPSSGHFIAQAQVAGGAVSQMVPLATPVFQ